MSIFSKEPLICFIVCLSSSVVLKQLTLISLFYVVTCNNIFQRFLCLSIYSCYHWRNTFFKLAKFFKIYIEISEFNFCFKRHQFRSICIHFFETLSSYNLCINWLSVELRTYFKEFSRSCFISSFISRFF